MDMFTLYSQKADEIFARKEARFQDIVNSILSQSIMTAGQRSQLGELVAREETALRYMQKSLDDLIAGNLKADSEMQRLLKEAKTKSYEKGAEYITRTTTAAIEGDTARDIQRSKASTELAKAYIDRDTVLTREEMEQGSTVTDGVNREIDEGITTASRARADSETELSQALPGLDSSDEAQRQAHLGQAKKSIWDNRWASKAAGLSPVGQAKMREEYEIWWKDQYLPAQSRMRSEGAISDLFSAPSQIAAQDSVAGLPPVTSTSTVADKVVYDRLSRLPGFDKKLLSPTGSTGVGKPIDFASELASLDLSDKETERYNRLLGREIRPEDVRFEGEIDTLAEEYVARAAFNRLQYSEDPAERDRFKSYQEFKAAAATDPDVRDLIDDTRGLDETSLKLAYGGEVGRMREKIAKKAEDIDILRRKFLGEDAEDPGKIYKDAVEQARIIYRELYGSDAMVSGIDTARQVATQFRDKSPAEVQAIIAEMPISERRKQALLKAGLNQDLNDRDLYILRQRSPALDLGNALDKLRRFLPSDIVDGENLLVDGERIPLEVASLRDLTEALIKGQDVSPESAAKLKEQIELFEKLSKNPSLMAVARRQMDTLLDAVGGPSIEAQRQTDNQVEKAEYYKRDTSQPVQDYQRGLERSKERAKDSIWDAVMPSTEPPTISSPLPAPKTNQIPVKQGPAVAPVTFNEGVRRQSTIANIVGPDAVRLAADTAKKKSGRNPTALEVIEGTKSIMTKLTEKERALVDAVAKQSSELKSNPDDALAAIFNPLTNPDKYKEAKIYVAMASNPDYLDLQKKSDLELLRKRRTV